jgi:hypothetical protein
MRIIEENGLPVIEATSKELAALAIAATGAIGEQEAVVRSKGQPQFGFRRVDRSDAEQCGRLGVGRGTDAWDPVCDRPWGHDGPCNWTGEESGA